MKRINSNSEYTCILLEYYGYDLIASQLICVLHSFNRIISSILIIYQYVFIFFIGTFYFIIFL